MPLEIEPRPSAADARNSRDGDVPETIVIGLVNNMPDSALAGTESQFRGLLAAAAGERRVRLRHFSLPEVPRGADARAAIEERYWPLDALFADPPDALIVTGTEPKTAVLSDEPYWQRLVGLIEFADAHTISSAWSCLAAHAAVAHLDGIPRRRLPTKRFGVFEQRVLAEHPLTVGLGAGLLTPHSRWNNVGLDDLHRADYRVLSASPAGEADLFCKQRGSLLVFFQGHPEYEERTLLKEYQRDVGRFINGEYREYPEAPPGYFDANGMRLTADFEARLRAGTLAEPLTEFPFLALAASLNVGWLASAARIYRNWFGEIARRKSGA
jgi:homoserine O-succinyltransferase